ncbi:porin [Neptunomonas antarctica]|uniref:Outer membrane protein (Porin) n=1 Tax=Neptunomonas antarctica TaxID=619304 RepID=A0A1N7LNZ4_9GAMM|nr:porin [Neptunomonas antarctica]SIS75548.1 Outer membrane protein (porin) [Neptunomonas antarctica]
MKKLILSAAIAVVAATSVNAATVYDAKGLKYDIKGDWQIQLRQKAGDGNKADVEFDDLEIKNRITYDLQDGMSAFGQLDFGFKDAAEGEQSGDKLEEAYLGLKYNNVSVSIGKQNFAVDSFGIEEAYESIAKPIKDDAFDKTETSGNDVVRMDVVMDNLTFIVSTEISADGASSSTDGEGFDMLVATEVAGVKMAAAYQDYSDFSDDFTVWGLSASYDLGMATIAADYSVQEDQDNNEYKLINVATTFKVAATTKMAIGLVSVKETAASVDTDTFGWYTNVTYKFPAQKNVRLFAEIGDTDGDNVDLGYLAGIRLKF